VQEVMAEKGRRKTGQQKHNWAFQGLLSCGHCGCALTAEIKKQKYVYYHCTGFKGKCPEKWVREEEVAKQFGQALQTITMDEEVLSWVVTALKESHSDKQKYHEERINALHAKCEKLNKRLEAMYLDKLDGRIDQVFYDRKSSEWKNEQDDILRTIKRHQTANRAYFDEGIKIIELSQHAVVLYAGQLHQNLRPLKIK